MTSGDPAGQASARGDIPAADVPVCGFHVEVTARSGGSPFASGELLAVDPCGLHVLTENGVVHVPLHEVMEVDVRMPEGMSGGAVALWTGLGTVSTLSHGVALIITAPLWLVTGGVAGAQAGERHGVARGTELPRLGDFARFPAGLPADRVGPGNCGDRIP